MFQKIIAFAFLPMLLLALILSFVGVQQVQFDDTYYGLLKQVAVNLDSWSIAIPKIPEIPHMEDIGGIAEIINVLFTFFNMIIKVLNILVLILNIIISLLQVIITFIYTIIAFRDSLIPALSILACSI